MQDACIISDTRGMSLPLEAKISITSASVPLTIKLPLLGAETTKSS